MLSGAKTPTKIRHRNLLLNKYPNILRSLDSVEKIDLNSRFEYVCSDKMKVTRKLIYFILKRFIYLLFINVFFVQSHDPRRRRTSSTSADPPRRVRRGRTARSSTWAGPRRVRWGRSKRWACVFSSVVPPLPNPFGRTCCTCDNFIDWWKQGNTNVEVQAFFLSLLWNVLKIYTLNRKCTYKD